MNLKFPNYEVNFSEGKYQHKHFVSKNTSYLEKVDGLVVVFTWNDP